MSLLILFSGAPQGGIQVSDSVVTSESVSVFIPVLKPSVSDLVSVSEAIALSEISFINVNDSISSSDLVLSSIINFVRASDSTTVSETINSTTTNFINVSDSTTVSEAVNIGMTWIEDWSSYANGTLSTSNWTQQIANGTVTYTVAANDGSTSTPKMMQIVTSGTNGTRALSFNPIGTVSDLESLALIKVHNPVGDRLGRFGILYNRYGGNSEATTIGYAITFLPVSGTASLILEQDSVGAVTNAPYNWTLDSPYWVRYRLIGSHHQIRIWPYGTAEPSTWFFDLTDTQVSTSSYSGIGTFTQGTVTYYQYSVGINGLSAPMLPDLSIQVKPGIQMNSGIKIVG